MSRKIISYGGYFETFMSELDEKVQEKIHYGLLLLKTEERLSTKFVKSIKEGLFELRIRYEGNIYRVFFSIMVKSLYFLMVFRKKHKKALRKKIEKALKIKTAYYEDKHSQNR